MAQLIKNIHFRKIQLACKCHAKAIINSVLVCTAISGMFFLIDIPSDASQNQHPISISKEVVSPLVDIATDIKKISSQLHKKSESDSWLVTFGPWFTGVVALLLAFVFNFLVPWWRAPKLSIKYESAKNAYAMKLFFDTMNPPFRDPLLGNNLIYLRQPGFNSRVKIINEGRTVAKNVQARLESVKCYDESKTLRHEISYHPSAVKWSGEKKYNKVDIAPFGSYFFLDLVFCINETYEEIMNYYSGRDDIPTGLIDPNDYSGNIYWDVWVDKSYVRGIPARYTTEGFFELNYHVMADNCKPLSFTACMTWEKATWNKPKITVNERRHVSS